ncbi:hypothetical protein BH23ACI1_BH23ACI1_25600 [soil metagenome]
MDISEVNRRLKVALDAGKRTAAERRVRSDEAAKHYDAFLAGRAVPVFQHMAGALTAQGHPFRVMTPSDAVRLSPEGSSDEFIELVLDSSIDPPEVLARVVRGRGRRRVETEQPLREGTTLAALTEEDVLEFLLREVVFLVQRS